MLSGDELLLAEEDRQTLLELARASIEHGLSDGGPLIVSAEAFPEALRPIRASFVTLHHGGGLRGCIGTLEAVRPLVADVAYQAYAAAFADPRFPPLARYELGQLAIHISVLMPPEPLLFESEEALLSLLRPGVDGLILRSATRRATFLPSVWQELESPREFVRQLKLKAGLAADAWPETLSAYRYRVHSIP